MKLGLEVIEQGGEVFFRSPSGLLFDVLDADPFEGGSLVIQRGEAELERTEAIEEYGTHAACVCFIGLNCLGGFGVGNAIGADDLKPGDLVQIESDKLPKDFNFERDLVERYRLSESVRHLSIGESMSMSEFMGRISQGLQAQASLTPPPILRFRSHPSQ